MTACPVAPMSDRPATRMTRDAPLLVGLSVVIALSALPLLIAAPLDARMIEGVSIWTKPVKFHAALVIYLMTLAFFARYLPDSLGRSRLWRAYQAYVAAAIVGELLWIDAAAALGTTSHFNNDTPVWTALYALMGVFAVSLTSLSLAYGIAVLRNPATGLPRVLRLGIGWGLVMTFGLTLLTAGTMSALGSHFVGTPADPANGLPLLGWSRETGDLRVAHFFATHALHAVPLAACLAVRTLSPRLAPAATAAAALLYALLVAFTFAQGLTGAPFLPGIG